MCSSDLTGVPIWNWEIFLAAHRRGITAESRKSVHYPVLERCFPWLILLLPMLLVPLTFWWQRGVLLTNMFGWLWLLFVLVLLVLGVFVAIRTRSGRGVVVDMSSQELRAWMSGGR